MRRLTIEGRASQLLRRARHISKIKGWDYDLDAAWIIERMTRCKRTDTPFVLVADHRHPYAPSIDRIDSTKGYTKDNCRIVAWVYNQARSNYSDETVNQFALRVVRKQMKAENDNIDYWNRGKRLTVCSQVTLGSRSANCQGSGDAQPTHETESDVFWADLLEELRTNCGIIFDDAIADLKNADGR
jgi:hypothetical protein